MQEEEPNGKRDLGSHSFRKVSAFMCLLWSVIRHLTLRSLCAQGPLTHASTGVADVPP